MGSIRRWDRGCRLIAALLVVAGLALSPPPPLALAAARPGVYAFYYEFMTIGEAQWIGVGFYNGSPTDTGYGPYIDLFLPAAGADGAGPAIDDGVTFQRADLYQVGPISPLAPTPQICAGGGFTHPLTRLPTPCVDGDQILVFELPFGSITPGQPTQFLFIYALMSNWADPGTPLPLRLNAGFWLGNDPLDNPASDPPITTSWGPEPILPLPPLFLSKLSRNPDPPDPIDDGPRFGETASGLSFPQHFFVTADIPDGQTFTDLRISDLLPATMVYSDVTEITPPSCSLVREPSPAGPQLPPNNELSISCPSITGRAGSNDVTFTFRYWVPRLDAAGAPVLDPLTGAPRALENHVAGSGTWQPLDPRDSPTPVTINPEGFEDRVRAQSIAVQHGAPSLVNDPQGNGLSPGDTLEYTLDFQIADYFSFDTVVISETLSDGQRYLPNSARLALADRGGTVSGAFRDGGSLTIDTSQIGNTGPGEPADGTDGSTTLRFAIDQALRELGAPDGVIQGAEAVAPRGAAAIGRVTFRTLIQERFTDSYPSGDPSVDLWDVIKSEVTISGRALDNQTLAPTGAVAQDTPLDPIQEGRSDNTTRLKMPGPDFTKTVYAINGAICSPQPCADPTIEPADTITYRLTYTMPFVDVENLRLQDFLPLPVFTATEILTGSAILGGGLPPPGRVAYGPADTLHTLPGAPAPTLTVDPLNNMVGFSYGDYDFDGSPAGAIDLLFTVTASDQPFDSRLFITNQASASEGATNSLGNWRQRSVEIGLAPLVLRLRKGVVATDAATGRFLPGTVGPLPFTAPDSACPRFAGTISSNSLADAPIDSDLRNLLPGDRLTFAIVVENYGSSSGGAFDVTLRDTLPPGLLRTAGPLCVTDGTGAPLPFTDLPGGLFGGGIRLNDPGATAAPAGALDPYRPEGGRNLAIITYDVAVADAVRPPRTLTNTVTLFNYAESEGGDDDGRDKTDPADVTVVDPTAVTLLHFSATRAGDGVRLRWATGAELNTRGFLLLRSADGTRAGAIPITAEPIRAAGIAGGGAAYTWLDAAAPPGQALSYWLVELERSGPGAEYGPARATDDRQAPFHLMLPLLMH